MFLFRRRFCRLFLPAVMVLLAAGSPATAQEKEYVLDTATGVVSQKDKVQDAEITALKAKVAELEKLVRLTQTMKEPEAAATSGTYPTAARPPKKSETAPPPVTAPLPGCPAGCDCLHKEAVASPRAPVVLKTAPAAGTHAHTCPRCGTTWSHTGGPGDNSHNCPKCGTFQNVVSSTAPADPALVYSVGGFGSGGGCASGNCAAPSSRFRLFGRFR